MNGIIKKIAFLIIAFLMVPLPLRAAQQEYYTIIAGTYRLRANAENDYKALRESIPDAAALRIEKNGKFYTVRLGRSLDKNGVERFLPQVRSHFKDARFLRTFYKPARVIRINGAGPSYSAAPLAPNGKAVAGLLAGGVVKPALSLAAALKVRHEILPRRLKKWAQGRIVSIPPSLTAALLDKQFFTVQLASFTKEHAAHREINRLKGPGFSLPWLRVERIQRFFTVRAGRFSTRRQAMEFMRRREKKIHGRIMAVYIKPARIIELYGVQNGEGVNNEKVSAQRVASSPRLRIVNHLSPAAKKVRVISGRRYKKKIIAQILPGLAGNKPINGDDVGATKSGREFFTLQTASFKDKKMALRAYRQLTRHKHWAQMSNLRVEMIAGYFTLRVGKFTKRSKAADLADSLRRFYPDLLVLRAYVLKKRIVQISRNTKGGEKLTLEAARKLKTVVIEKGGGVELAPRAEESAAKTIAAVLNPASMAKPAGEAGAEKARGGRETFIFKAAANINENKVAVKEKPPAAARKAAMPGAKILEEGGGNPLLHSVFAETNLDDKDLSYEVVTIIGKDDRGENIRMPSSLFYDRHRDELYAINGVNNRIIVYGADYFPQNSLGKGRGIDSPMGGFIGNDGKIYITQAGAVGSLPRITVLNGAFMPERVIVISKMPNSSGFIPQKITINTNGRFYITGLHSKKVLVLDRDGKFLRWFHVAIDKRGEYFFSGLDTPPATAYIRDVVSDSLGNLFFLSEETSKVYAFNVKENFLFSFGVKGGAKGKLSRPRGLCVDEDRRCFYVVDYMRHEVLIYDFTGKFRHEFGGRGWGAEWFNYPVDIVLGAQHQVVVADFFNQQVKVFSVKWRETFPARPDNLWKLK